MNMSMPTERFEPGTFVRIPLTDGTFGYGRLLRFPYAAFYRLRTEAPVSDLSEIARRPLLFKTAVHKSVLEAWEAIGSAPPEPELLRPFEQFMQKLGNESRCTIVDSEGRERPATPEECVGLDRVAVWEPNHIADRILDTMLGRPNKWVESTKVKLPRKG